MPPFTRKFYLVSNSPRRLELLNLISIHPIVVSPEFDEQFSDGVFPQELALQLAKGKLNSVRAKVSDGLALSADTLVILGSRILGKPSNHSEAEEMLRLLSDQWHSVITGFSLWNSFNNRRINRAIETRVHFRSLEQFEINEYIESGSPFDKAGGYGIQDSFGAIFVDKIEGDFYNVVGLPLSEVYRAIKEILHD
ncbi:MAG: septum formation protein Maf [Ignavibacteriaceae bacterium]|nr:septum formation protein Maf [Ignavibacteriaceae bacterium]